MRQSDAPSDCAAWQRLRRPRVSHAANTAISELPPTTPAAVNPITATQGTRATANNPATINRTRPGRCEVITAYPSHAPATSAIAVGASTDVAKRCIERTPNYSGTRLKALGHRDRKSTRLN